MFDVTAVFSPLQTSNGPKIKCATLFFLVAVFSYTPQILCFDKLSLQRFFVDLKKNVTSCDPC